MEGITLYMQPMQDLTVEDRVSRTQFQYTLEDPDINELNTWTARLMEKLKTLPQLQDRRDRPTNRRRSHPAGDRPPDRFQAGDYTPGD